MLRIIPDSVGLHFSDANYIDINNKKGLNYCFEFSTSLEKFQESLQTLKEYDKISEYDLSSGLDIVTHIYSEKFSLYVTGTIKELNIVVFADSPHTLQYLFNLLSNKKENSDIYVYVETYSLIGGKVNVSSKVIKQDEMMKLNKLYYPYIDTDVLFEEFFKSKENILLLTGKPGLGKSKLAALCIQYAIDNPNKAPYPITGEDPYVNLVYIRGIDILASEEFWIRMEEDTPDLVIIDDLDNMLTTREAEIQSSEDVLKNKFMNLFLSFTDGVERNNTKFIITTNQNYQEIDKAILREGRLFDILEMRELSKEEALKIWVSEGLPAKDFPEVTTAAKLGSEIHKYLNSNSNRSYLLESNISKTTQAKSKRTISI